MLVAAGHDPATPIHVYRGATLALTVRSIGAVAALEIGGEPPRLRVRRAPTTAPPMRENAGPPPEARPAKKRRTVEEARP
jgi:hypothetical protein